MLYLSAPTPNSIGNIFKPSEFTTHKPQVHKPTLIQNISKIKFVFIELIVVGGELLFRFFKYIFSFPYHSFLSHHSPSISSLYSLLLLIFPLIFSLSQLVQCGLTSGFWILSFMWVSVSDLWLVVSWVVGCWWLMGIAVVVVWILKWIYEVDRLVFMRWMDGSMVAGVWLNSFWVCRHGCARRGSVFCSSWV